MEYICTIFRNTENLTSFIWKGWGLQLPLFTLHSEPVLWANDIVYFFKEDRYTPHLINVMPPIELTEEQLKTINKMWNKCIEENIFNLEFEL